MDKSYHPAENTKDNTDNLDACSTPRSARGIDNYEDRELRKHCIHLAAERFGCADAGSAIHMAKYLYEWIKTGKEKIDG